MVKGVSANFAIVMVIGIVILAFGAYFLGITFTSNKTNISESTCKSILSSSCSLCIFAGNNICEVNSEKAGDCSSTLSKIGIILNNVNGNWMFSKDECQKIGVGWMFLNKGLATKMTVLLIISILVLFLSIYLIVSNVMKGSTAFTLEGCKSSAKNACNTCLFSTTYTACKINQQCIEPLKSIGMMINETTREFDSLECRKLG